MTATGFMTRVANPELKYLHFAQARVATEPSTGTEVSITSYHDFRNSAERQVLLLYTTPITQISIRVLTWKCKDTRTCLFLVVRDLGQWMTQNPMSME